MSKWIVTQKNWIVNTSKVVTISPVVYADFFDITAFMGIREEENITLGKYRTEDGKEVLQQVISFLNNPTEAVFIMPEIKVTVNVPEGKYCNGCDHSLGITDSQNVCRLFLGVPKNYQKLPACLEACERAMS